MNWPLKVLTSLKLSLLTISAFVLLILLLVAALFTTHTGSQIGLNIVQRFEPRLTIELEEGSFVNSPLFRKIRWQDANNKIEIDAVRYQFDWSCLFNTVCLQQLTASDAQIDIVTNDDIVEPEPESQTSIEFKLPIDIAVQDLTLKNLHVTFNNTKIDLNSLHLQLDGKEKNISLNSVIDGLLITLPATADTPPPKAKPTSLTFPALLTQQMLPEIVLPLNLVIDSLKVKDFALKAGKETLLKVNALTTQLSFSDSHLAIQSLALNLPETDLKLDGKVDLSGHYPLNINIQGKLKLIDQLESANLLAGQRYSLKSQGDLAKLKVALQLSEKISMQMKAEVDLFKENLPHNLQLDWQNLHWPLVGAMQYSSASGSLHSHGTLNDYQIKLKSDYLAEGFPRGDIALSGKGDLQQFTVEELLANTLDGTVGLTGLLKWQQAIQWDGQLAIEHIDLQQLESQYTGNFSGSIKHNLQVNTNQETPLWQFSIAKMQVDGLFLEKPFAAAGKISGDSQRGIVFQNVTVDNADNKLLINGLLAEQNDLLVNLNLRDLNHLLPEASGKLQGKVEIQGPRSALHIESHLLGDSLAYQTIALESIQLDGDLMLSDMPTLSLQLKSQNISIADQVVDNVTVNIKQIENRKVTSGSKTHQLDLSVKTEQQSADIQMQFIQDKTAWLSELTNATINPTKDLQLKLEEPFALTLQESNLIIDAHCWKAISDANKNIGELCVNYLNLGKQGKADLVVKAYPLESLDSFLPEDFKIQGALNGEALLQWNETEKPLVNVSVSSQDAVIKASKPNGGLASFPLETVKFDLLSNKDNTHLSAVIYSLGLIDGKLEGQLFPYKDKPEVDTLINLKLPNLSRFSVLIADVDQLTGQLNTQLAVSGPVNKPVVNGQINLVESAMSSMVSPLQINRLNTTVTIENNQAIVDGAFTTAKVDESKNKKTIIQAAVGLLDRSIQTVGQVISSAKTNERAGSGTIKGTVDWRNELQGDIHLVGNEIAVNDYDKIDLLVSPDVHLIIAKHLTLSGVVVVNKGSITARELPAGAITISKDVIVVDAQRKEETAALPIVMDLQIDLGQSLKIKALGLDSTVQGSLLIHKSIETNPTIHGTLTLSDGSYRALSQKLILQNSKIIFQGAADSPYISIEAIRDPSNTDDDVIAGVRVTGTPDELSLQLFSEPAMSQQDALAYLIRGQSLENSRDRNNQIANMLLLLELSTSDTATVLGQIGDTLGISDLSLSTNGTGDQQSVGVSGYIGPRIELSYGIGVFDSFTVFAIRYELFERFYIEASSGLEQAIDAYYEFDWD